MRQCSNYRIKKFILLLTFLVIGFSSKSQYSKAIDSSIVVDISSLDTNLQAKFLKIYNNLFSEELYSRIDSIVYSSVIIEARCVDTTLFLEEFYYKNIKDKFPSILYVNGEYFNVYDFYNDYDKDKLTTKISNIKKTQTLNYHNVQLIYSGCIKYPDKKLKKDRKERLQKTFQIQIFVDSKKNLVKTSLQVPLINPDFKMELRFDGF